MITRPTGGGMFMGELWICARVLRTHICESMSEGQAICVRVRNFDFIIVRVRVLVHFRVPSLLVLVRKSAHPVRLTLVRARI